MPVLAVVAGAMSYLQPPERRGGPEWPGGWCGTPRVDAGGRGCAGRPRGGAADRGDRLRRPSPARVRAVPGGEVPVLRVVAASAGGRLLRRAPVRDLRPRRRPAGTQDRPPAAGAGNRDRVDGHRPALGVGAALPVPGAAGAMTQSVRRIIISVVATVAVAGIWWAFSESAPPKKVVRAGIEAVSPPEGDLDLRQVQVGVDLAPGYTGMLYLDNAEIPEDDLQRVPAV